MSVICLKAYREQRVIKVRTPIEPVSVVPSARTESVIPYFADIQERLRARFGEVGVPAFVEKAWLKPQSEPYRFGDSSNCQWRTVRERYWNRPMPFPMPLKSSVDVIGKRVAEGGTDPLMWMDLKYRVSWNHIQNRRSKPLVIHTRSDLVAHDDYLAVLDGRYHRVVMYVLDALPEVVRREEPGAPSNERRRKAVDKLIAHGIPVQVVHIPVSVLKRGAV